MRFQRLSLIPKCGTDLPLLCMSLAVGLRVDVAGLLLIDWRNVIVHQDFDPVAAGRIPTLPLASV